MLRGRIATLAVLTSLVALLALVQNRLMVQALGAGPLVDAYYLIMTLPMALTGVFSVMATNLITPAYTRAAVDTSLDGVGRLLGYSVLIVVGLMVLQVPVSLAAGLWSDPSGGTAWRAALLLCVGAVFYGVSYGVQPLLVARGRAWVFTVAQSANAALFIALLMGGAGRSLTGLAGVFVIAAAAQAALTVVGLARSAAVDWSLRSPLPERVKTRLRSGIAPTAAAVAFTQASLVVDRLWAESLGAGMVTTYYLSDRIVQMLVSVSAVAVGLVVFAELSDAADERSGQVMARAIEAVIAFFAPVGVALWLCGPSLVALLFGGGRFDAEAVARSGLFLRYLGVAMLPMAVVMLVPRRLQSTGRYAVQTRVAFLLLAVNLVAKWALVPWLGLAGLPASVAIAYAIAGITYLVYLVRTRLIVADTAALRRIAVPVALALLAGLGGTFAWGSAGAHWAVAPVAVLALWSIAALAHNGVEREAVSIVLGRQR